MGSATHPPGRQRTCSREHGRAFAHAGRAAKAPGERQWVCQESAAPAIWTTRHRALLGCVHCASPAALLSTFCAETVIQHLAERHVPVTTGAGMGTSLSTLLLITLLGLESLKVSACFLLNVKPPCSSSANTFSPLRPASKTQVSRGGQTVYEQSPTLRMQERGRVKDGRSSSRTFHDS